MIDALAADGLTPERRTPRHPKGVRRGEAQMDLDFVKPVLETPTREIRGMVRETGSIESQRAACDVLKRDCAWVRWRLMQIATTEGPFTARMVESRNEFRHAGFAPNTIRRRITDLKQAAERGEPGLVQVGRQDKLALWGVAP